MNQGIMWENKTLVFILTFDVGTLFYQGKI